MSQTHFADTQRIEAEIKAILEKVPGLDVELQASLARLLCILASGYLESSCREIISQYAHKKAEPSIARYVEQKVSGFQNPNCEKLLKLAGEFGKERRERLEAEVTDEIKDSVDSICANRNNIAHGRTSGISIARAKGYYENARKFVRSMQGLFPAS